MKKLLAATLTVLVLLSCMTAVSADAPRRVPVTACDTVEGWDNNDAPYQESNIPDPVLNKVMDDAPVVTYTYSGVVEENGGWKREDVYGTQGMKIAYKSAEPLDLTGMNYLIFDLYVSDASKLEGTRVFLELTSTGRPDMEEHNFLDTLEGLKGSPLVDGWNRFGIPFNREHSTTNGALNFAAWNFLRIYNVSSFDAGESLRLAFRNLYFCEINPYEEEREEGIRLAARAVIDLFTPLSEIDSAEDITAESYETVKAQLAAALEAHEAAEPEIKEYIFKTFSIAAVETSVKQALADFEAAPPAQGEPSTPTDEPFGEDETQEPSDKSPDEDEAEIPSDGKTADTATDEAAQNTAQEPIVISPLAVIAGAVVLVAAALGSIALFARKEKQ